MFMMSGKKFNYRWLLDISIASCLWIFFSMIGCMWAMIEFRNQTIEKYELFEKLKLEKNNKVE